MVPIAAQWYQLCAMVPLLVPSPNSVLVRQTCLNSVQWYRWYRKCVAVYVLASAPPVMLRRRQGTSGAAIGSQN